MVNSESLACEHPLLAPRWRPCSCDMAPTPSRYVELYRPFPVDEEVTSEARVVDVLDKGSGVVVLLEGLFPVVRRGGLSSLGGRITLGARVSSTQPHWCIAWPSAYTKDSRGNQLCMNQFSVFIRGLGGYGGVKTSSLAKVS